LGQSLPSPKTSRNPVGRSVLRCVGWDEVSFHRRVARNCISKTTNGDLNLHRLALYHSVGGGYCGGFCVGSYVPHSAAAACLMRKGNCFVSNIDSVQDRSTTQQYVFISISDNNNNKTKRFAAETETFS